MIKSHTDLEQSKKLAEILPIESADMWHHGFFTPCHMCKIEYNPPAPYHSVTPQWDCPCWSLAALFNVLPDGTDIVKDKADTENEKYMCTVGVKDDIISTFGNNSVDACVAMIERLHELNLL